MPDEAKNKNVKDLIHRHQALLFVFTYHELLRLAQINGSSVILICQKGQKYCLDIRKKTWRIWSTDIKPYSTYHELLRLAQINGSSVILICQKGQKYCLDIRKKTWRIWSTDIKPYSTYHELLRLAQINGSSVILICQKGQKYCRDFEKEKNVKDLIHRHKALLFVPAYHEWLRYLQ